MRSRASLGLIWTVVVAATASAQVRLAPPRLPGESPRAAQRLREAQELVAQGQFADAIEEFQRLLNDAGDELLAVDQHQAQQFLPMRFVVQQRLAALPPAALRLYRARVDQPARKLFEEGRSQREPRLLYRIVNERFCSRCTDQALDLLGDLAFERGDFEEAERCWQLLAPLEKPGPQALVYPDPQIDLAQVRAKHVLARLCRGERQDAERQLAAFRQQHDQAAGHLAGRNGNYAAILAELAQQFKPAAVNDIAIWPTFAGSATRQRILAVAPRCRWLAEPWRTPITGARPLVPGQSPSQTALAYAYHPAIVDGRVILADTRGVSSYDLWTGTKLGRWDLAEELKIDGAVADQPASTQGPCCTLTVASGRVFVRLAAPAATTAADSYLLCLDMSSPKPSLRWQIKPEPVTDGFARFEGAPVVAGERVLIAWSRFSQGRCLTGIDCCDIDTGGRLWRQEVSETREPLEAVQTRQLLLTLAGRLVLCSTHAGSIVALDWETGQRAWALRYPRRGYLTADGLPTPRDLAPPLVAAGRVLVAPADSDVIWCLDPASGRVLWQSQPVEVVHLLGVAANRLIFATGNRPRGIQALELSTGLPLRNWVYPGDGQTDLPAQGRGFLAGSQIFFPRLHGWDILRQDDGRPDLGRFVPLDKLPPGNMACASGCLVVATDHELLGYVPERHPQAAELPGVR